MTMTTILLIALFSVLMSSIVIMIMNQFQEKKVKFDRKYFIGSAFIFGVAFLVIYLYNFLMDHL